MAERNYYVLSILCTDEFWSGNSRNPLRDLNAAVKYSSYQAALNDVQAFMDATMALNIEVRQMIQGG